MLNTLLFIGAPEIMIILLVVLLLFGSKKIPDLARGLGKGMNEFRKATDEIKKEISDAGVKDDINDLKNSLKG